MRSLENESRTHDSIRPLDFFHEQLERTDALQACQTPPVSGFAENQRGEVRETSTVNLTLGGGKPGQGYPAVSGIALAPRRLTPVECERLQAFPDNYTLIPWRGKAAPDGPRYKALGNSMAVNVMRWIGTRIQMVENMNVSAKAAAE